MKRFRKTDQKMALACRLLVPVFVLFLLNACLKEVPDNGNLYAERITIPRQKKVLQEKQLAAGICGNADQELDIIKNKLSENGFSMTVLHTDSTEDAYPLLRTGRIDLIVGKLSEKEIRSRHFKPIAIAIGDQEKTVLYFAIRPNDVWLSEIFNTPKNPTGDQNGKRTSKSEKKL